MGGFFVENLRLAVIPPLERAKHHVLFHHHGASGWITIAKKDQNGTWRQYHYRPEELATELSKWLGEDVYFSQNTFYKPQRRIENIRQLRALYVDVDCHLLNYDPDWVVGKLDLEVFQDHILPNPNIIIFSGRGLVCIWLLEPVPYQALPLWKAVQNYFCEQLNYVGADKKSLDPTRVFRIDGTINSKNKKEVVVEYRHDYRYVLRDLQYEYLPELASNRPPKRGRKPKIVHLHNVRTLHYARLLDLVKLAELRDYDLKGYRELFCFLYRYWSCCFTDDPEQALQQVLEFNSEFKEPLSVHEAIRATRSAEKAWRAKSDAKANEEAIKKGYPGAGYNLKNSTIIRWFDITPEEQRHLQTIIDGNEKLRRKRERDKKRMDEVRREQGAKTREEYLEEQKEKTEDRVWQLQKAMERHPNATNKQLAEMLQVSVRRIQQLKKMITN
jgi:hypothetical protein